MTVAWDGRSAAWIGAWDRVEAMSKIRIKYGNQSAPLPEWYWALRAEAELLVGLANVPDPTTGIVAGQIMEDRQRAEAEADEARRSMVADLFSKKNDEGEDDA